MDEVTPLIFKIGDTQVAVENSEKSVKLVNEFLTKNTPKMDEYYHQEWTDDTFNKVAEAIVAAIPQKEILEMILGRSKDTRMNELVRARMGGASRAARPAQKVDEDLEFTSSKTASEPVTESTSSDSDDEYDSLFSDL